MFLLTILFCFHCIFPVIDYNFFMQGKATFTINPEILIQVIDEQQKEIELLRAEIRLLRHNRFGASSEKISPDQVPLFLNEDQALKQTETPRPDITVKSHVRKPRRRLGFDEDLPVDRVELDLPEDQKTCSCCAEPLIKIGEETSRQAEHIPATVRIKEYVRFKYACRRSEGEIRRASTPPQLIKKSFASSSLVANLVVSKYVDHMPLYRIEKQYQRLGIYLPRSTQCAWVIDVAEKVDPLYALMKERVLCGPRIWTDDTIIPPQNDDPLRKKVKQARLWNYIGGPIKDPPFVVFDFTRSRSQEGPLGFLQGYAGYLQADAYAGYQGLYESGNITEVACWAHTRRKFYEAAIATQKAGRAAEALQRIADIYRVEWACKEMNDEERKSYRLLHAKPLLLSFKQWADQQVNAVLPKSPLGKALYYMLNHWDALNNYLEEGFLKPDNNKAEQHIRPVALGRKNYLFVGSDRGGRAAATWYSLMETCRHYEINPLAYLTDILTRIAENGPAVDYAAMMPDVWQK